MPQVCNQCRRVNPAEASYCYFDGALLAGHAADGRAGRTGPQPFATPFVFSSGLACRNFDQLAMACQQSWKEAVELVRQGYLARFLGSLGRADLALAAEEAARFPDLDRGLDQFLSRLPSHVLQPPKLSVEPTEINLGVLPMGTNRTFELHLSNQGMRLLYGSVVSDSKWLTLGEPPGNTQKLFQFGGETVIPVQIRGQHLRAGAKALEGALVIESNGGSASVRVRADVPVLPFSDGVLAGAVSPRQVAEKAKASPQEAAPLFEKGLVARWFTQNGWQYPVQGPPASGLGAVQQFFEALGLVKPPRIEVSPPTLQLKGQVGQFLSAAIRVFSKERRPVYAYATGDQPWLDVGRASFERKNPVVTLPVQVHVPNRPGETLHGNIRVTGNGNQRFVVPLALTIEANPFAFGTDEIVPVTSAPEMTARTVPPEPFELEPVSGFSGNGPASLDDEIVEAVAIYAPAETLPPPSPVSTPVSAFEAVPVKTATGLPASAAPIAAIPLPAGTGVALPAIPVAITSSAPTSPETVTLRRPAITPAPGSLSAPQTLVAEAVSAGRRTYRPFWIHLIPLLALGLALIGVVLRDWFLRNADVGVDAEPRIEISFDYGKDRKKYSDTMSFGLYKLNLPEPRPSRRQLDSLVAQLAGDKAAADQAAAELLKHGLWSQRALRDALAGNPAGDTRARIDHLLTRIEKNRAAWLTAAETGRTNSAVLKLDTIDKMFGDSAAGGSWRDKPEPIYWGDDVPERLRLVNLKERTLRTRGMEVRWVFAKEQVLVTQTVELVPGQPVDVGGGEIRRLVDTCLVRYRIENLDSRPHKVGMRFLLHLATGADQGTFFLIPGDRGLADRPQDLIDSAVPYFIQGMERASVRDPGTMVQLNLRPSPPSKSEALEPPSRVSLTRWPQRASLKRFDVPLTPTFGNDAAIAIYWEEKKLEPRQSRNLGFAFGTYDIQARGRIGLVVGGDSSAGGELAIVALVNEPVAGEQLTLTLPAEFVLTRGAKTQDVPVADRGRPGAVTWHVRAAAEGLAAIEVLSSMGDKQSKRVRIGPSGPSR